MKQEKQVIDFTDKFDKLLNSKPKSGSLKEWNKKWDLLTKEFLNEESEGKNTGKKRKKKAAKGKNVGGV